MMIKKLYVVIAGLFLFMLCRLIVGLTSMTDGLFGDPVETDRGGRGAEPGGEPAGQAAVDSRVPRRGVPGGALLRGSGRRTVSGGESGGGPGVPSEGEVGARAKRVPEAGGRASPRVLVGGEERGGLSSGCESFENEVRSAQKKHTRPVSGVDAAGRTGIPAKR